MTSTVELPLWLVVLALLLAAVAALERVLMPSARWFLRRWAERLIGRLEASADPAAEGIAIAAEQVVAYRDIAQGVHLMAIKAEERIPAILEQAGLSSRQPVSARPRP